MANDTKQYQEEEYLFSEDDAHADPLSPGEPTVQSFDQPASEKAPFFKMWRKNLIVGVGLLLVVFVVYKVISSFFVSNDAVKKIPAIPTQSQSQPQPQPQPAPTIASPNQNSQTSPDQTSLHDAVNFYNQNRQEGQQLTQLQATTQNMNSEVSSLQTTTQSLQSSIDNINAQLGQLNTALTTLTNKMQVQENRLLQSQKKARAKKIVVVHKPLVKQDTYQTMAVIPGRAWLKSSRGATITVSSGTTIPGYGQVTVIDTQSGRIMTSSGKIIQYAPDDE